MLFHHFINSHISHFIRQGISYFRLSTVSKISALPFTLLCLLVVSCSSVNNSKDSDIQQNEQIKAEEINDLKTMSSELIALVDPNETQTDKKSTDERTDKSIDNMPISNKNVYLDQKYQLMADIPDEVIAQYQQGISAMNKKQWSLANDFFDQVILAQPKLSGAYVNKALIYISQNKMVMAQHQIDKALNANNVNPYAYNIQGQLLRLQGDFTNAEQSYLTALTLWPNYADVHWNLAVLLELYRGRYADAKRYYLSFLKLKPADKQGKRAIAALKIKMARLEKKTI